MADVFLTVNLQTIIAFPVPQTCHMLSFFVTSLILIKNLGKLSRRNVTSSRLRILSLISSLVCLILFVYNKSYLHVFIDAVKLIKMRFPVCLPIYKLFLGLGA